MNSETSKEIYAVIDRFCKVTLVRQKDYLYKVNLILFQGGELTYKFKEFDVAHNFYNKLLEGIYEN